jgi:nucleotide sugar dehydrogenase
MSDLKTPRRRSRSYRREGELHLAQIKTLEWGTHHGFVYSLETEPSHTFAATHGIVVHNCIPVDPQYLAWRVRGKVGRQFRLLETASDINQRMPSYVVQRAAEILNGEGKALRGARVLLLGVSYKGGSGDVRESPSLRVADRLVASGADVSYHDPYVPNVAIGGVVYDSQPLDDAILQTSDLVIVLTDHPDVDYERVIAGAGCVYDTRGVTAALVPPSGHSLHRI